jgi:hypothetical protein
MTYGICGICRATVVWSNSGNAGKSRHGKHFLGRLYMLASNRLRIDPGNGSPAMDYRIERGFVESRNLDADAAKRGTSAVCNPNGNGNDKQWHRLTPEQLTSRVMKDHVVAQWLRHKLGLHRLVQACQKDFSASDSRAPERPDRTAA